MDGSKTAHYFMTLFVITLKSKGYTMKTFDPVTLTRHHHHHKQTLGLLRQELSLCSFTALRNDIFHTHTQKKIIFISLKIILKLHKDNQSCLLGPRFSVSLQRSRRSDPRSSSSLLMPTAMKRTGALIFRMSAEMQLSEHPLHQSRPSMPQST